MVLLLQPIFRDLQSDLVSSGSGQSGEAHDPLRPGVSHGFTDCDDNLYTMWRVATKIKSVMAEGARFENLTWRAWSRNTQLVKASMSLDAHKTLKQVESSEFCLSKSQATTIPRSAIPSTKPSVKYNRGYSTVLAEIQQAGARRSSLDQAFIPTTHLNLPVYPSSLTELSNPVPSMPVDPSKCSQATESSETSTVSGQSPTNNVGPAVVKKKKKNVDRFIKKQHRSLRPLEKINEIVDEASRSCSASPMGSSNSHSPSYSSREQAPLEPVSAPVLHGKTESNSFSTTDTLSGASMSDLVVPARNRKMETRRTSQPKSSKSSVSLLTMLLNRNLDVRRPDSCPPDSFPASPPSRPRGPLPTGSTLDSISEPAIMTSVCSGIPSTSYAASERSSGRSADEAALSTHAGNLTRSATTVNNRRRAVPTPPDFTTPLYIW